jgi:hypothetical protein
MKKTEHNERGSTEILDSTKNIPFVITSIGTLKAYTKPVLIEEVFRLQTALAELSRISEAPDYGGPKWSLKMHPLVLIRGFLRGIAFKNLGQTDDK